ncbi:MAG: hypothetical protein HPY45_03180 [Anaerolineae bacterium]|nr:hypothetical protein [Anaerolineae bacterium]
MFALPNFLTIQEAARKHGLDEARRHRGITLPAAVLPVSRLRLVCARAGVWGVMVGDVVGAGCVGVSVTK